MGIKDTQRRPHFVRQATMHNLPAIPSKGFWPVYLDGSGVHLAANEAGKYATAFATRIWDDYTVGLMYDGVIYTPNTPLAQRTSLYLDATAGGVVTTEPSPVRQVLGEIQDSHHTLISIHQPQNTIADTDANAKNALVYPVGNFTALAVNDAGTGADGAVYKLPTVDALQITLPNKADMNAAEGIWRVRISGNWAALATQTTALSFIDDTANGVDMGTGLPDDGNEWLDLVFDAANDKWIATSGGDVTLTQVVPTYTLHTEVPANIRLYLIDGTGASAEGLYRKETVGDAPNHIG